METRIDLKARRSHRLSDLLRAEVSNVMLREVGDPLLRGLTVSEVDIKPDLRSAIVFLSKMTADNSETLPLSEVEKIQKGLKRSSSFIYEKVKSRLGLRAMPALRFEYDERLSRLSYIWGRTKKLSMVSEETT